MNSIARDFVSEEPRKFRFKLGRYVASSLTGFAVGVLVASVVWLIGIWYLKEIQTVTPPSSVGQPAIVAKALL